MRQAAPILAGVEWEVDDAAPTWVKSEPLPSDLEATRVWREDRSGIRATGIADFADDAAPLEQTLVFPLERRLPPASAFRSVIQPPPQVRPPAPAPELQRSRVFATSAATFCVMAVLFALALPWVVAQLP